jgi:hypothetical protein
LHSHKLEVKFVDSKPNFRVREFLRDIKTLRTLADPISETADRIDEKQRQPTSFSINKSRMFFSNLALLQVRMPGEHLSGINIFYTH